MSKWISAALAVGLGVLSVNSAEPASESASPASVGQVRADSIRDLIVGKWQVQGNAGAQAVIEFTRGGKLKVAAGGLAIDGSYKFLKDTQIEVEMSIGGVGKHSVKLDIKVAKDQLITTEVGQQRTETFTRTK